jgi:hypothetical protein
MEQVIIYVDKITLEDLIEFQNIEFEIIKGYYYDEGRNPKITEVITHLFETRKKMKNEKKPIESVYKLLMNASYGKTLLKPFETQDKYISGTHLQTHISRNFNDIKEIVELVKDKSYKVVRCSVRSFYWQGF